MLEYIIHFWLFFFLCITFYSWFLITCLAVPQSTLVNISGFQMWCVNKVDIESSQGLSVQQQRIAPYWFLNDQDVVFLFIFFYLATSLTDVIFYFLLSCSVRSNPLKISRLSLQSYLWCSDGGRSYQKLTEQGCLLLILSTPDHA